MSLGATLAVAGRRLSGVFLIGALFASLPLKGWSGGENVHAQSQGEPPSVMDRVRKKAAETAPTQTMNWFERIDLNRDGSVSREELGQSVKSRFRGLDMDGSGVLDRTEFDRRNAPPASPGLSFEILDANRDGLVSEAEFAAPARWRFARLDRNGDGRISRAEAEEYLNAPTGRFLPPLSGKCYEINGRYVIVSPETAARLDRDGGRPIDCAWRPGASEPR